MKRGCVLLAALAALCGCGSRGDDRFTSPDPATKNPPREGPNFGREPIGQRADGKFEKLKGVLRKIDFALLHNDVRQIAIAYEAHAGRGGVKDVKKFIDSMKTTGDIHKRIKDGLYVILPDARNARDVVVYEKHPDGNGEQLVGTRDGAVDLYRTEVLEERLKEQGHERVKPW
jgi:hypothetical protein